ncbi:hypothetical protein ACFE04_019059 [Oxalis oulophora]
MTSPLPISTADQPSLTTTTPAFRAAISRLTTSIRHSLSQSRPWSELLDRSALSRPDSVTDAASRIRKNLSYFKLNYTTLLAVILSFSLFTNPLSLILLLLLLTAWAKLYLMNNNGPLVLFGRTFSDVEKLGVLIVLTVVVVFLTSVGSVLITASMIGFTVICVHGAFRAPEDLFLDDQDPVGNAGLLSFLGGPAAPSIA